MLAHSRQRTEVENEKQHRKLEQLINVAPSEMASLFKAISNVIDSVQQKYWLGKRRKVEDEEVERSIVALHYFMKATIALELLDSRTGD